MRSLARFLRCHHTQRVHAISERLAREIPGARLAKISATAHVPSMERPREFDELVAPFLEENA